MLAQLEHSPARTTVEPPESYCPPSASASGWHVKTSKATRETIPYFIGYRTCKETGEPKKTLFVYLGPLKLEHSHWSPIQTFPIQLVRKVANDMLKDREGARLNEID